MSPTKKPTDGSEDLPMPDAANGRERRTLTLSGIEWRESVASGTKSLQMRGHASVFDSLSLDLGGFREIIAPGAFARALEGDHDVHLLWDHDTRQILARTGNAKYRLDLSEDEVGLAFRADVAPTSYANDLRILMESGVVDQASFAFTVERDSWEIDEENDVVIRTVEEVGDLYDVTVTARGAYSAASSEVVEHMRSLIRAHTDSGELPADAEALLSPVTPEVEGESESLSDQGEDEQRTVTDTPGGESSREHAGDTERVNQELRDLKALTRIEAELAKRRLLEASR